MNINSQNIPSSAFAWFALYLHSSVIKTSLMWLL
jgi:hypothetical protein